MRRQIPTNSAVAEPSYRLIHNQANRSYVFKWEPFDLGTRWHYHPELELIYFIKGKTNGIVGREFMEFEEGQLVLLGENLPHVLQPNEEYFGKYPGVDPFGLIIQFRQDFLGDVFFNADELKGVKKLIERARRGIIFSASVTTQLAGKLEEMHSLPDKRKLVALLDVLLTLSEDDVPDLLTKEGDLFDHGYDEARMLRINEFLYKSFAENIKLKDVADLVNMTESSFCRYFRSRTLKNFTRYLNEIRISYACKLLLKPGYNVSDACFESGFNSLSYFNRQFNAVMKASPKKYQQVKSLRFKV